MGAGGMERLATGYGLIEGPVWDAARGLLFSDVINGGVHCLPPGGGAVTTIIPHRRGIGGMAPHANGGLVVSGRNVAWKPPMGEGTVVLLEAEAGAVGFNDLTADPAGRIVVGSLGFSPIETTEEGNPEAEQRAGALHVIGLDGAMDVVATDVKLTNGLATSPDGQWLYHCDSRAHVVWRYPVGADGAIGARAPFAEVTEGLPDGMAVAEDGGVWIAVADGGCVLGFGADGARQARLEVPQPMVTSVCFGGEGLRDLYVVTGSRGAGGENRGSVFITQPGVAGHPVPLARVAIPGQ